MEASNSHISTRLTLTRDLQTLRENLLALGGDCCSALSLMISSLLISSEITEQKVFDICKKVEKDADELESSCFRILSLQQPLLKDLRLVVASLRMSSYFIRIANYTNKLVIISSSINNKANIPEDIKTIAESYQIMLSDVLIAFKNSSSQLALNLIKKNKDIDLLHDSLFYKIIRRISGEDFESVNADAQLLTAIRFLERIEDIIASIAKEVYFVNTGQKYKNHV